MAWNDILAEKDVGGLAIGSLRALNLALISKWWWRLKVENDSLWSKVIRSLHGYRSNLVIDPLDTKKRGVWRSISDVNKQLLTYNIDLNLLFVSNDNIGQPNGSTSWSWRLDTFGLFMVTSLRRLIDDSILINSRGIQTLCLSSVPSKVNIMVCRMMLKRLATKANLAKRSIPLTAPSVFFVAMGWSVKIIFLYIVRYLLSSLWKSKNGGT